MKNKIKPIDTSDEGVLRRFMQEFFHYPTFRKIGFFTDEMKGDYKAQAARVCYFFGYDTVFEYRAEDMHCHISYAEGHRPKGEGFITHIPSIYKEQST